MRALIFICCLVVLAGCVPPSENQLKMEMDLQETKRRLTQLETQRAEALQTAAAGDESIHRQLAELQAGLDNLRVEVQSVNGRIDDLGYSLRSANSEVQLFKDDLGLQLGALDTRMTELEKKVSTQATDIDNKPGQVAPPAQTVEPVVTPPAVTPPPAVQPALPPEQLYDDAIVLIRDEKKFSEGRQLLETFVANYPQHELYVNALYWIGEALYGEKQYEQSILKLQDVITRYPGHSKTPAAMLKQALGFAALGDKTSGITTLQKLVNDYPDSVQAEAARKYLQQNP